MATVLTVLVVACLYFVYKRQLALRCVVDLMVSNFNDEMSMMYAAMLKFVVDGPL